MSEPAPALAPATRRGGGLGSGLRGLVMAMVTAAVLGLLVRRLGGLHEIGAVLRAADWNLLPIPLVLVTGSLGLSAQRWRTVLEAMGYRLAWSRALEVVLSTWPLAVLTPSRASDLLRAVAIRDVAPVFAGAGSVLAEKAVDVQSLCLVAAVGAAWSQQWGWLAIALGILAGEWVVILMVLRWRHRLTALPGMRRFASKVELLFRAFEALLEHPRKLMSVALTSLVAWVFALGIVHVLLRMVGVALPWQDLLALWPIAVFVGMIPVTMAGMGTRDAAFVWLLSTHASVHTSDAAVLTATLGYSLIGTWLFAIIGLPFAIRMALTRGDTPLAPGAPSV